MSGCLRAVIASLENGAYRASHIHEETGIPLNQIYARLHDLVKLGAATRIPVRGARATQYRLKNRRAA